MGKKTDGFMGGSILLMGAILTFNGLSANANEMVRRGDIQPIWGIVTMMWGMEILEKLG